MLEKKSSGNVQSILKCQQMCRAPKVRISRMIWKRFLRKETHLVLICITSSISFLLPVLHFCSTRSDHCKPLFIERLGQQCTVQSLFQNDQNEQSISAELYQSGTVCWITMWASATTAVELTEVKQLLNLIFMFILAVLSTGHKNHQQTDFP